MYPPPIIFGYQLDWFQDLQYLAIAVSILIFLSRRNYWKNFNLLYVTAFVSLIIFLGYIGSRSLEVVEGFLTNGSSWQKYSLVELLRDKGGMRWYGALLFNFAVFYFIIKFFDKGKLLGLIDEIVLAASGGLIIGKVGCGLSGHGCYGIPTTLPWGMRFPYGSMPSFLPVHPTPLYDAFVYAILFGVLIWVARNKKFDGQLIIYFLIASSVTSFLIEIIRTNESVLLNFSLAQVIYLLVLISTIMFYRKTKLNIKENI